MFDAGFKLGLLVTNVQNPKRQKVISSLSPKEWFEAQTSKLKFHETDVYLYFCHDRPAYVSYVTHPCCPCRWFCPRGALFHSPSGTAWRFSGICWALSGVLRLSRWDRSNVYRCPHRSCPPVQIVLEEIKRWPVRIVADPLNHRLDHDLSRDVGQGDVDKALLHGGQSAQSWAK